MRAVGSAAGLRVHRSAQPFRCHGWSGITHNHVILVVCSVEDCTYFQGTIAKELMEQVPELDAILVSLGGGGLSSGISKYIKETHPTVKGFRKYLSTRCTVLFSFPVRTAGEALRAPDGQRRPRGHSGSASDDSGRNTNQGSGRQLLPDPLRMRTAESIRLGKVHIT